MYSATVLISIQEFVPMTGDFADSPSIVAKIFPPQDISPPPQPETPVFSGDGQSIYVTVPAGYVGSVQLIYQLPDPRYVMAGVAFKSETGTVGRIEFPSVEIERDPYGSEMVVTDACIDSCDDVSYNYVILVQEVATGNIGLIDPDVETDTTE